MRLLFSEYPSNYEKYQFPYQVWAIEDGANERDSLLNQGFLPTRIKIGLWYVARSSRVDLSQFEISSENRRIVNNTNSYQATISPIQNLSLTNKHFGIINSFCKTVIGESFSESSIKRLFSHYWSHSIIEWHEGDKLIGISPIMYTDRSIFYWYGFLDPDYSKTGLGMRMMLEAVTQAKQSNKHYAYLGTIYTQGSRYKTNLKGFQFFNGMLWSSNLDELAYILEKTNVTELLKDAEYLQRFYDGKNVGDIVKNTK